MRIQTTIAASANIPTVVATPIPAFVPSVMFDMVFVEPISEFRRSQGRSEVTMWIDDDGGAVGVGRVTLCPI